MSLISNDFPGASYLARLKAYTDNPTPVKGIDFVCPLALKALERLKDSNASEKTIKLDNDLNLDDNMDEVWISGIQKAAENLPPEVIEKLSSIFNTFLQGKEDTKNELAALLVKITHENSVDLFNIFEEALSGCGKIVEKFKASLKNIVNLSIKIELCNELLIWIKKVEFKRISIIYKHHELLPFSSVPIGLNKAKKDEIYDLKMKYFNLTKENDQTIYSNEFFLNFYKKTCELFWEEEVKALIESNEICYAQKISLQEEEAKGLLSINEKYEILFKEEKEQQARREEAFKIQREVERQRETKLKEQVEVQNRAVEAIQEQVLNLQNRQPNRNSLDEINRLMLALEQKQNNKNKKCVVM